MTPTCGAKAKSTGKPCQLYPCKNGRCHLHGGKSTGPKTERGKIRSNYARLTHGCYSQFEQEEYRKMRAEMKQSKELIKHVDSLVSSSIL
jgi:hypothetical protein